MSDERVVNERLRAKHIRTLEMLQEVVKENDKLKARLEKVVAFSDGPPGGDKPKLFAPCHSDQLEFKLAEDLRLLKIDYDEVCRKLREMKNLAEQKRLSTEKQAEARIGVAKRKQQEAERKLAELQGQLGKANTDKDRARRQSKELQDELSAAEKELNGTHSQKSKQRQTDADQLRAQLAVLEKEKLAWGEERTLARAAVEKFQQEVSTLRVEADRDREMVKRSEELVSEAQTREHAAVKDKEKCAELVDKHWARAEDEEEKRSNCEKELEALKQQIYELRAQLAQQTQEDSTSSKDDKQEELDRLRGENDALQAEVQRLGLQLREEREDSRNRENNLKTKIQTLQDTISSMENNNNGGGDAMLKKENFMLRKQLDEIMRKQGMRKHLPTNRQAAPGRQMGIRQLSGGVGHSNSRGARGTGGSSSQSMPRLPMMR